MINNNGDILYEYKFLEDALKNSKYSIETTIVNIESNSGIKPYYFFFATNAMLTMYDPLVDEQFFDCIKKHEDRITFKLDEILKTLKENIKLETEHFNPLTYRCCSIDEEINFLERLKESE